MSENHIYLSIYQALQSRLLKMTMPVMAVIFSTVIFSTVSFSTTAVSLESDWSQQPPLVVKREALSFAQLHAMAPIPFTDYLSYAPPLNSTSSKHVFSGRLSLGAAIRDFVVHHGTDTDTNTDNLDNVLTLPSFDFDFVQHGDFLLPTERQVVGSSDPRWEWILAPGKVWQEPGDKGYSRAALPFALQEVNANCTHNGVMTFLFNSDAKVSNVAFQIAQETCAYFKFDLWGIARADYRPVDPAHYQSTIDEFEQEIQQRIAVQPITTKLNSAQNKSFSLSSLATEHDAEHLTAWGVYYGGTHYQECHTRAGQYPFCEQLALPVYSLTKSLIGALGLMRLEALYPGSVDRTVSELIANCNGPQWRDVTLLNLLDMATGNYHSSAMMADEGAKRTLSEFFAARTHVNKIAHSCAYPRKGKPGSDFVYHTSDTYLLSTAMQQLYQQQAGAKSDYFDDLIARDIFTPLHLSPLSLQAKRTYDDEKQVWGGYGLTLLADDMVKLGRFLNRYPSLSKAQKRLAPELVSDALQQTEHHGIAIGKDNRYQHGFWAYRMAASVLPGCDNDIWVPYLSGFGGISLVLLPNDMLYYFVSDNHQHGFATSLIALHNLHSFCPQN